MRDEAGTRVRIKIKGNKEARKRMIRLMDMLEKEGVEIDLEIKSTLLKKNRTGSR